MGCSATSYTRTFPPLPSNRRKITHTHPSRSFFFRFFYVFISFRSQLSLLSPFTLNSRLDVYAGMVISLSFLVFAALPGGSVGTSSPRRPSCGPLSPHMCCLLTGLPTPASPGSTCCPFFFFTSCRTFPRPSSVVFLDILCRDRFFFASFWSVFD